MSPRYAFLLLLLMSGCAEESSHPLAGTWHDTRWTDSTDLFQRTYRFDDAGTLTIEMRRPPTTDTTFSVAYAISRDSFLTLSDAHGSEQFIARVDGDTLRLRTPEMTSLFVRVGD